ncbi:hypothetical protein [Demequina sp.]|uniref:hypothetical protein n=1 Tax=Demequina sp. TaxID=2050685 RepID=UPI003D0C4EB0
MKTIRIIAAAFLVLLGSMMLMAWAVAGKAINAVESGEAANNLTQKLLEDPTFSATASEAVINGLDRQTEGRFLNRIVQAFRPELERVVQNVLESERVNEVVTNSVDKVSAQLTEELTKPDRATAPFVLSIDVSDRVNQRIDEIPVVGLFFPDVTVPPIEKELIDAATFDQIRGIYGGVKAVASWGFLVALVLVVAGFFVAPRSRWYWPQALLAVGFVVLAVSIVVRRILPISVANALPGGSDSAGGTFVKDFLSSNATGPIASRLLSMALWSLVLAVLFWVIARQLPGFREKYLPHKAVTADGVVTSEVAVAEPVVAEPVVAKPVVAKPVVATTPPVSSHAQVVDTVELTADEPAPATEPTAPVKKAPARKPTTKATATKKPAAASGSPKTTRARKPTPPKE